jgi:hypothetical protein
MRLVKAEDLQQGMVLLLPMAKTATISNIPQVGTKFVSFSTEYGKTRVERGSEHQVDLPPRVSRRHTEYAKHLLIHYFATAFEAAGLKWDNDNVVEIEGVVDSIIEAARGNI